MDADMKAWRENMATEREASQAETKAWQEEMAAM
jgi:FtsZ-binding cell division protein ZapB